MQRERDRCVVRPPPLHPWGHTSPPLWVLPPPPAQTVPAIPASRDPMAGASSDSVRGQGTPPAPKSNTSLLLCSPVTPQWLWQDGLRPHGPGAPSPHPMGLGRSQGHGERPLEPLRSPRALPQTHTMVLLYKHVTFIPSLTQNLDTQIKKKGDCCPQRCSASSLKGRSQTPCRRG